MNCELWLSLLFVSISLSLSANKLSAIEKFEEEFKIQIILEDSFQSSYAKVSYKTITDENRISLYIDSILTKEFRKYPKQYFTNIGLSKIILGQNLSVVNQKRSAMPDPLKKALILSIESIYETEYLIHVLHHEMHHITEFSLWQNMYFQWKKWERKNPKNYQYGQGGSSAYEGENKVKDWYALNHPQAGFLNLYSTTGQEEDRCEMMALIMSDSERTVLKQFSSKDKYLKRKIRLTLNLLDKVSQSKKNYWRIEMKRK